MQKVYNIRSIAARFEVSPATVYMWLEMRDDPNWGHSPTPAHTHKFYNSYNADDYLLGWDESTLPDWDRWYENYKANKYATQRNASNKGKRRKDSDA